MQFMLMHYETEAELARRDSPTEAPSYWAAWNDYIAALSQSGIVRGGNGLMPSRTATTVRVVNGQRRVQDGPFAETREHLGGYFIIDVPSLDVALEWAARSPSAAAGSTEVRPVMPPPPGAPVA